MSSHVLRAAHIVGNKDKGWGMKDIDFDELDRAVSSVLTQGAKVSEPAKTETGAEDSSKPNQPSASVVKEIAPAVGISSPPVVKPRQTIVPSTPSPAARRSGRFMDVVHPSSDMKVPTSVVSAKPKLQPLSSNVKPEDVVVEAPSEPIVAPVPNASQSFSHDDDRPTLDTIDSPVAVYDEKVVPEETVTPAVASPWPDPLEVDSDPTKNELKQAEVEETKEVPGPVVSSAEAESPTQTPFIADAKVDKRPLGGFSSTTLDPTSNDDAVIDELSEAIQTPSNTMPRELENDVVRLDSNESEPEVAAPAEHTKASAASIPATPLATSIPQQYKSSDTNDTDLESHGVFDTDSYHQPLLPPKTGAKRIWVWVLLIVGLLIVGAGLGALWFMIGF